MENRLYTQLPLYRLVDIYDSQRKPVKKADRKPGPYPYYGASGVADYVDSYIFDGEYLLLAEDGENLKTQNTPIAFMAKGKFWVNNHAHILQGNEHSNTRFLCYAMQIADVKSYLSGSTRPKLTQGDMKRIPVFAPPLTEQKAIAHILGSFDDKIELNRRMNKTLEAMAQALFKSWFVDFDPVIDNALVAGKPLPEEFLQKGEVRREKLEEKYGELSPFTLQTSPFHHLFPSEFEHTGEMGWIPMGWKVSNFGKVSNCFDSKRIPLSKKQREQKQPGTIPYYGATSVMDYVNEWIFDDIYLLIGEDGSVLKEDGSPFVQYIWGQTWVNNHAHVLQGASGVSTEHLMLFMQSQNITAYVTGAVQLKINQKNMNSIPFLFADDALNSSFAEQIDPMYQRIRQVSDSNKYLSKTRDSLLPQLLSGEMRIPEAEKLIKSVNGEG